MEDEEEKAGRNGSLGMLRGWSGLRIEGLRDRPLFRLLLFLLLLLRFSGESSYSGDRRFLEVQVFRFCFERAGIGC